MAMRMTGLASGLDTESMVKELVSASSEKVNKIKQKSRTLSGGRRFGADSIRRFITSTRQSFLHSRL